MEKLLNIKRSMFYDSDDQGRISYRGKYLAEFTEEDYKTKIRAITLSGYKGKNLQPLAEHFPLIERLTIEKTSNLKSLHGIEVWENLGELNIEDCSNLADFSSLELLDNLKILNLEKLSCAAAVLKYVKSSSLRELYLNDVITDMDLISDLKGLEVLSLNGSSSVRESLPLIPFISKSFGITGFKQLKSASFLENLTMDTRIRWWGPNQVSDIPDHLKAHEGLKSLI
jgi:Leucine-rich repeat (LRR) protein